MAEVFSGIPIRVRVFAGLLLLGLGYGGGVLSPAHAQPRPDTADISSIQARQAFVRGMTQAYLEDYEEAVTRFEQALDAAPRNPAILSALADAEFHRENVSTAIFYARQAREQAPDRPYYHLELARLLQHADQFREATAVYRQLLDRFPGHLPARRALAQLRTEQARPRAALRQYEALVDSSRRPELDARRAMLDLYREVGNEEGLERTLEALTRLRPETPRYRRRLGDLYIEQGRYQEAIALLEPMLQRTPRDPRLLSQLQMLYTETGQSKRADTLGRSVRTTSASPDQLVDRARMLYSHEGTRDPGTGDSVIELLQSVLERAPDHPGALDLLGTIRYEDGQYAAAAPLLRRAVNANPRSPDRWRRAVSSHLHIDSVRQAATLAEEARLLFPGRPDLLCLAAEAHLRLGHSERARNRFRTALAQTDTTTTPPAERTRLYIGLGTAWQQLGRLDSARVAYEDALQLTPSSTSAQLHLARVLADQATQLDRGLRLARRAVRADSAAPAAFGTLGWVHTVGGEYDRAADAFEHALERGPAPYWVYERFGDLHHTLGNDARARQYWKQALDRAARPPASLRRKLRSPPQS
jgi:tetratricopeptide (TPR) repeat protein